jgi:hypothetical protein
MPQPTKNDGLVANRDAAPFLGWIAFTTILLVWFVSTNSPLSRHDGVNSAAPLEMVAYQRTAIGLVGAIIIGIGLRAARQGAHRWAGWLTLLLGSTLALWSMAQLSRWLF